ncbi:MAG TPA: sulfatase-like hydrolase/transferase, partial [Gemmataceae bacterium]
LAENTLVVFASDNGGTRTGRNAPLSGNKGTLYEGGIRVPCIVRRPGHIKPGTTDDRVAITMDLTASIVRAAGATPARAPVPGGGRAFDGIDVLADIGAGKPAAKRTLFWRARRGDRTEWAVRDGDLKYLRRKVGERTDEHLFDLAADIAEKRDLLAQRPQDAARLKRLLGEWEKEVRAGR